MQILGHAVSVIPGRLDKHCHHFLQKSVDCSITTQQTEPEKRFLKVVLSRSLKPIKVDLHKHLDFAELAFNSNDLAKLLLALSCKERYAYGMHLEKGSDALHFHGAPIKHCWSRHAQKKMHQREECI